MGRPSVVLMKGIFLFFVLSIGSVIAQVVGLTEEALRQSIEARPEFAREIVPGYLSLTYYSDEGVEMEVIVVEGTVSALLFLPAEKALKENIMLQHSKQWKVARKEPDTTEWEASNGLKAAAFWKGFIIKDGRARPYKAKVEAALAGEPSLFLEDHLAKPPMGESLDAEPVKRARQAAREKTAMEKLESLRLYVEAVGPIERTSTGNGKAQLSMYNGAAAPFLGYIGPNARFKVSDTWIDVPRNRVKVLRYSPKMDPQHANLVNDYHRELESSALLRGYAADAAAAARERSAEQGRQQLHEWEVQRSLRQQQQALDNIQRELDWRRARR